MEKEMQLLESHGLQPTSSRLRVIGAIMQHTDTFSLMDLENALETVDKSTIFRALNKFLERGIIHEVDDGSGSKKYCFCTCSSSESHKSHIHFTCLKCHKTMCIKNMSVPNLKLPPEFSIVETSCLIKGICPDCQRLSLIGQDGSL